MTEACDKEGRMGERDEASLRIGPRDAIHVRSRAEGRATLPGSNPLHRRIQR